MKRIDGSPEGITDIAWSPDGKWLTYVCQENQVRVANVDTGEIRDIGQGECPSMTNDLSVLLQRADEIVMVTSSGSKRVVTKSDVIKDTPKRAPLISPDGSRALFNICNVFDKKSESLNAYPYRHFFGLLPMDGKPKITEEQWYGGTTAWFPDNSRFLHFEFDSTGGPRIHIVKADGEKESILAGLYPAISPDGKQIATRPRSGGAVVVYSQKNSWAKEDVSMHITRIPVSADNKDNRISATPPVWIDNRFVLVDDGQKVWRADTKRDKADDMKKMPIPTQRRRHSMTASPTKEFLAVEVEVDDGFELRVISLF